MLHYYYYYYHDIAGATFILFIFIYFLHIGHILLRLYHCVMHYLWNPCPHDNVELQLPSKHIEQESL